jgi:hypothetical protein
MKILASLFLLIPFCVEIHALDLNEEAQKAVEGLSKQLQKSKILKVGPRLFNREVTPQMWPKPGEKWIGIVGDSSATGAASHQSFRATLIGVLSAATKHLNPKEQLLSPIRVMYTTEEFKEAERRGQAFELNVQSDLSQKIDTEEYPSGMCWDKLWVFPPIESCLPRKTGPESVRCTSRCFACWRSAHPLCRR